MFVVDRKHKCAGVLRLAGEQRTIVAIYLYVNAGFLQVWLGCLSEFKIGVCCRLSVFQSATKVDN